MEELEKEFHLSSITTGENSPVELMVAYKDPEKKLHKNFFVRSKKDRVTLKRGSILVQVNEGRVTSINPVPSEEGFYTEP